MVDQQSNAPPAEAGTRIVGSGKSHPAGPGPQVMAADTLQGDDIQNPAGERLGTLRHIMIDVPRGRVAYAVLSQGGVMGVGGKLFAIPWSALTLDTDRKCFVLDVDKERLKNAAGFDKDNWPRAADPQWLEELYEYYDQPPYG